MIIRIRPRPDWSRDAGGGAVGDGAGRTVGCARRPVDVRPAGLAEFTAAAPHLADAWRVPIVRVAQLRPGVVRTERLLRDPLTDQTQWTGTDTAGAPAVWLAGVDADGQPVTIRSSGVSGVVVVAGLAGYGKTSFLNARFSQLVESVAVQFVLIDGKGGPDYDDLFALAWLLAKDDPETVCQYLGREHALMTARQHAIRAVLGVKNMWHHGPTAGWPLSSSCSTKPTPSSAKRAAPTPSPSGWMHWPARRPGWWRN